MALVGNPASVLMDFVARVFETSKSTTPPSRTLSPSSRRQWAPSSLGESMIPVSSEEDELMLQVASIPSGPTEAIASPSGSSTLPMGFPRGPPVPCYITSMTLPAEAFKKDNLRDFGNVYICRGCDKMSSNQDNMVSHYLKEHLGVIYLS